MRSRIFSCIYCHIGVKTAQSCAATASCSQASLKSVRYLCSRPKQFAAIAAIFMLLLLIAGCVISPRRVVVGGPSPTPTPTISPTPTPTPTPMAAAVPQANTPAEFLFLSDAGAPLITGFRINGDGSLAPIPGSPFTIGAPAGSLTAAHGTLIVTSGKAISAYKVDKETGSIQPMDSAVSFMGDSDPSSSTAIGPQLAVLDSRGRFMYVVDINRAELLPYRVDNGKLFALSPSAIPIPSATTSIAIVKP